jgi:dCTP deaminase
MKLGGEVLAELFRSTTWRGYRGSEPMAWPEIEPLIGPNSIDVTLGNTFLIPRADGVVGVDPRDAASLSWETVVVPDGDIIVMNPTTFMLGSVRERFVCDAPVTIIGHEHNGHYVKETPRTALFAPMYEGRSSCGRLGLASHITAGFGDYGFGGAFTLELNLCFPYPLTLHPGMRIGQVAFDEVYLPKRYKGAYSGDNHHDGPVPPKLGPDRF